ncbi:MAG: acylphosphatase [Salinisphaeraceae bacterium]|nr:acylphosphatase [Salinisphaeraceae bacterium]
MTRRYLISGTVQGVGFRYATCQEAEAIGLQGWVRNLADGRVEVVACGNAEALHHLEGWLRNGPSGARVAGLQIIPTQAEQLPEGFEIRR